MEVRNAPSPSPARSISRSSRTGPPSPLVASRILELQKSPPSPSKCKQTHHQAAPQQHHYQQPQHVVNPYYQQQQQPQQPQRPVYQSHHQHHSIHAPPQLHPQQVPSPHVQVAPQPPQLHLQQVPSPHVQAAAPQPPPPPQQPTVIAAPQNPPMVAMATRSYNPAQEPKPEPKPEPTKPIQKLSRFKQKKMEFTQKVAPYIWPSSPASFITGIGTGLLIAYIRPTLEFYLDIGASYFSTALRFGAIWGTIVLIVWILFKIIQRTSAVAMSIPAKPTTTTNDNETTKKSSTTSTTTNTNQEEIASDTSHVPGYFYQATAGNISPSMPSLSDASSIVSSSASSAYSYGSDLSYETAHAYRPYDHHRSSSSPSKPRSPVVRQAISSLSMAETTTPTKPRSPSPTKDRHHQHHHHSPSPSPRKPAGGRPMSSHSDRSGSMDVISGEAVSVLERRAGSGQAFRLKQRR